MYLKTLRLRGFKSFAEPVELHFERGVSVIVGPNGSGKSNVADGLQWAMASQPPSELRTQVAADVLFGGSARRQPSGLCEVELVLDNEDGSFGTGRPEISVMRRLRRDADAQYLLNRIGGAPARRPGGARRRRPRARAARDRLPGPRRRDPAVAPGRPARLHRGGGRARQVQAPAPPGLGKLARVEANLSRARDLEARAEGAAPAARPAGLGRRARRRAGRRGRRGPHRADVVADRRRPPAARTDRNRSRAGRRRAGRGWMPRSAPRPPSARRSSASSPGWSASRSARRSGTGDSRAGSTVSPRAVRGWPSG